MCQSCAELWETAMDTAVNNPQEISCLGDTYQICIHKWSAFYRSVGCCKRAQRNGLN